MLDRYCNMHPSLVSITLSIHFSRRHLYWNPTFILVSLQLLKHPCCSLSLYLPLLKMQTMVWRFIFSFLFVMIFQIICLNQNQNYSWEAHQSYVFPNHYEGNPPPLYPVVNRPPSSPLRRLSQGHNCHDWPNKPQFPTKLGLPIAPGGYF